MERLWADAESAYRRNILATLTPAPSTVLLDVGCDDGAWTDELRGRLGIPPRQVHGLELVPERAELARERGFDVRQGDLDEPWPFEDASVDVVWASEVLAFVVDTARVLSEVRRVLRPAGRLLVTTPAHGRVRALLRGLERDLDPLGPALRFYTPTSLRLLLQSFGFDEISVRAAGGPPLLRETLLAHARRAPLLTPSAPA